MPRRQALGADVDAVAGIGGNTIVMQSSGALNIGDVVSMSGTAKRVQKTAVAADAGKFVGVVVGGGSDFGADEALAFNIPNEADVIGKQIVSAAGKSVVLQVDGIATCVAGAAIAAGATVGFDTGTAGRVLTNAVAGQQIGVAVTAAAGAGSRLQVFLRAR